MPSMNTMPEISCNGELSTSQSTKLSSTKMQFLLNGDLAHDVVIALQQSVAATPVSDSDSESDDGEGYSTPAPSSINLYAHRYAMMQRSSFFAAALRSCEEISIVTLPVFDVSLPVMMAVLEFCYYGNLQSVKGGNLVELGAAADHFGVPELKQFVIAQSKLVFKAISSKKMPFVQADVMEALELVN